MSGVYAEDISCDDSGIAVSDEVQTDISSCDVVSSNYLTDSEVSDSAQINNEYSDNEELSSTINVDEVSHDDGVSSDLGDNVATNPAYEVGKIKHMSIDYDVASNSDENDQMVSPTVVVGNGKFIQVDYTVGNLTADGVIVPTVEVENCKFILIDYSESIHQDFTCVIISGDIFGELDISTLAQNCIIQQELGILDSIESVLADVSLDIEASENSNLGRNVTARENNLNNFESVDVVFVITTEGVLILNGKTNEPAIEGVIDNAEYISYKEVYFDSISGGMPYSDGKEVYNAIGADNVVFVGLADGFNESISLYVLQEASFHRQICEETNSGYTITKELLQYYPTAKNLNGKIDKGNIIVMEDDSNLLGSYDEDEQCLKISSSDFNGQDLCNPLWFNFILKQSDGSLMSIYMRCNEDDFFIEGYNWTQTYNLISSSALSSGISESAYPDGIDNAIGADQWSNQKLSNYATSESAATDLQNFIDYLNEIVNLINSGKIDFSSLNNLGSLEDINNEDLSESVATNIDNAKDNTKTNINTNCTKFKSCNCSKCNHLKCNCSHCKCRNMNCSNGSCCCNCSHSHGHNGHHNGHHHYHGGKYTRYWQVREVFDKIGDSYGMWADNSTDMNSTDENATVVNQGPLNIPKPVEPTNFNTLIISLAGILVLGVLFGISHRRQKN